MWPSHASWSFWCVLAMSMYWCAIKYAGDCAHVIGNYRIPPGIPGILYFHYPVLYCHPLTSVIFLCDTSTSQGFPQGWEHWGTVPHNWVEGCTCFFSNFSEIDQLRPALDSLKTDVTKKLISQELKPTLPSRKKYCKAYLILT